MINHTQRFHYLIDQYDVKIFWQFTKEFNIRCHYNASVFNIERVPYFFVKHNKMLYGILCEGKPSQRYRQFESFVKIAAFI